MEESMAEGEMLPDRSSRMRFGQRWRIVRSCEMVVAADMVPKSLSASSADEVASDCVA